MSQAYYREYSEKRDFIRLDLNATLNFKIQDDNMDYSGRTYNLSGGGVLFQTSKPLGLEEQIELSIFVESGSFEPLKATGTVVRISPSLSSQFIVAVKFLEVKNHY